MSLSQEKQNKEKLLKIDKFNQNQFIYETKFVFRASNSKMI